MRTLREDNADFEDDDSDSSDDDKNKLPGFLKVEDIDNENTSEDSDEGSEESIQNGEPALQHIYSNDPYYHKIAFTEDLNIVDNEEIVVYMCVYVICNNTYNDPYITYLCEYDKNGSFYSLPSFVYEPMDGMDDSEFIRSKCFQTLYPVLNIKPENVDEHIIKMTKEAFKGYIHLEGTKEIIVGINADEFIPYLNRKNDLYFTLTQYYNNFEKIDDISKYNWVLVDEIFESKKICDVSIDPKIKKLLENYPWIYKLLNKSGEETTIPKSLFSKGKEENKDTVVQTERSFHKDHGRIFLFTENCEDNNMKRYVVFPVVQYTENNAKSYGVFTNDLFREF